MRGETRRKARRCIRRRSIAARIAVKTTGAAVQGAGVRPRPRAPRRTPEGAKRGHGSGRSGTDRSRGRRVAQDSTPTAYMYTPSGSKDAQIARPAQGVPLPEPWPHVDRQTSTRYSKPKNNDTAAKAIPRKSRKYQAWSLPMNSQGAFFARSPPRNRMP